MKRALTVFAVLGVIVAALLALRFVRSASLARSTHDAFKATVEAAVTNPVGFAKSRFTGGVGLVLRVASNMGVPVINHVIAGSPAEAAGLREGDAVLKVDGVPTNGQKLAQVVDRIRGFTAGSVTLTIQRMGSTNLECVLHRSSWNSLGVPQ